MTMWILIDSHNKAHLEMVKKELNGKLITEVLGMTKRLVNWSCDDNCGTNQLNIDDGETETLSKCGCGKAFIISLEFDGENLKVTDVQETRY